MNALKLAAACHAFINHIKSMPDDTPKTRHLGLALNNRPGELMIAALKDDEQPKYGWGWIDGEDDNEGDKWIQISELDYTDPEHPCLDDEMAVLMVRNYESALIRFPDLVPRKEREAQMIVDALNS